MTIDFYRILKKNQIDCKLNIVNNGGHDWKFWATSLAEIFEFFNNKFEN